MNWEYVELDEYQYKQSAYKNQMRSQNIQLSEKRGGRNVHDLRKHIECLILLNPDDEYEFTQGKKDLQLGALFTLNQQEFLLKIIARPS